MDEAFKKEISERVGILKTVTEISFRQAFENQQQQEAPKLKLEQILVAPTEYDAKTDFAREFQTFADANAYLQDLAERHKAPEWGELTLITLVFDNGERYNYRYFMTQHGGEKAQTQPDLAAAMMTDLRNNANLSHPECAPKDGWRLLINLIYTQEEQREFAEMARAVRHAELEEAQNGTTYT